MDRGYLGETPLRIDAPSPSGLRVPSGREWGAGPAWLPGGYTSGGIREAVIDQLKFGQYTFSSISRR